MNTIDIKPVDDAPRPDDDLSVLKHAELLQLWNKAPAFREEGELFRGMFKPIEDAKRVFDAVMANETSDLFNVCACRFRPQNLIARLCRAQALSSGY